MQFLAEIRKVASRKLITSDMEYTLLLTTNDSSILDLGKHNPDILFEVKIDPENNK